ncbi:glutamine amidotransferase [Nocardioides alpinus]|uniref:Glutamine amidotransferase n=1 Tax=Nocardioides alpinus TaxID=748909 RepID=A0A1I1BCE9_9ACTN|nr:class II glutamine amidotransferase [Nocardioides alpinus]PKH41278.1 class II glutamine amidotransferase [Nocardioides alpinus]SFB46193.1 glutamine amidotransferase [Nocardioides alpinus]
MCRVLAYIGPEVPLESLLLTPSNSLVNQALDPEHYPDLHLAGWGFGAWSQHLLKPEDPFIYHRPMAAFNDDNATRMIPSLQASTVLGHVRAASYDSKVVMVDENCHPFSFDETPWIMAQNGDLPSWMLLQRELLQHCEDRYLKQMRGTTDTEFLYVLLLSLLEGDGDEDVQRAVEEMVRLIARAMEDLDLPALTKLKMALVSPNRIIGVNVGLGHHGETDPAGDWKELRESGPGTDDYALSMLLEPMHLLLGRHVPGDDTSYDFEACDENEATVAMFASEPLTEDEDGWSSVEFGEIVFLEKADERVTRRVDRLKV